jgi:hypothetical protein
LEHALRGSNLPLSALSGSQKAAEGMKFGMGLCLKALPAGSLEGRSEGFRDPLPLKIRFARESESFVHSVGLS